MKCSMCNGSGIARIGFPQAECNWCKGRGKIGENK